MPLCSDQSGAYSFRPRLDVLEFGARRFEERVQLASGHQRTAALLVARAYAARETFISLKPLRTMVVTLVPPRRRALLASASRFRLAQVPKRGPPSDFVPLEAMGQRFLRAPARFRNCSLERMGVSYSNSADRQAFHLLLGHFALSPMSKYPAPIVRAQPQCTSTKCICPFTRRTICVAGPP